MSPHTYSRGACDFIDDGQLLSLLVSGPPQQAELEDILARSRAREPLTPGQTAVLLRADRPEQAQAIFAAAHALKEEVYGNRIVLFAPLYVGNQCVNDCSYCGFRLSNLDALRRTLNPAELEAEVRALQAQGHKRLVLVFGEHPSYDADYMADTVERIYAIHEGRGDIRRLNINAAPQDLAGFARVKQAGIGTWQIFQETFHHTTYAAVHPTGPKHDYLYRLDGPGRAIDAGCDDVGIGALFGLYDWRFEVLGLVAQACHLQKAHGVGPHTISFPRLQPAQGVSLDPRWRVDDAAFKRLVAVLRLAVPYTGLILTARESAQVRREVLALGVSQIDAGSRIEIGGYASAGAEVRSDRRQFALSDTRPLDEVMAALMGDGYLPSFCTACYRLGRTGEHFMEFAIPGFIKRFCTPNALCTLAEYLQDYATEPTRRAGWALIQQSLTAMPDDGLKRSLLERLAQIQHSAARDLYF